MEGDGKTSLSISGLISAKPSSSNQNSSEDGNASGPVAAITVAALCLVLIILAVSVLILILKKTRRRIIVIKPPDIQNPHYNHLSVLSEDTKKRFSLKRMSWKFMSYRSSTFSDEVKDRNSLKSFPNSSLPAEAQVSLPSITSNSIPNLSPSELELQSLGDSKEYLLNSSGPRREAYLSLADSSNERLTSPMETSSLDVYNTDDAKSYEIPGGVDAPPPNFYSQLKIPGYSVLLDEGFYVPSEDKRKSDQDLLDHFATHGYNKLQFFEQNDQYWVPACTKHGLYAQLASKKYREILREQMKINQTIGSGNFGSVYRGVWEFKGRCVNTAVKILKADSSSVDKVKFLQEAAIMGQFFHPNIVRLHGVVTVGEPVMIVLELLAKGDLLSYLRKLHPLPDSREQESLQRLFLKFSREIASGMDYLSKKCFLHRDLAARNVLLNYQLNCKIGDFGMARDLIDEDYYKSKGGKMPIKWTAPEGLLFKKFSTGSDVWSYGILLYEIWSLGACPFVAFSNSDMISLAFTGICHPPPPGLPRAMYKLMVDCWNPDHSYRPRFEVVCSYLSQSDSYLLDWSNSDLALSPLCHILGASHHESNRLYKDLQRAYKGSTTPLSTRELSLRYGSTLSLNEDRQNTTSSTIPTPRLIRAGSNRSLSILNH